MAAIKKGTGVRRMQSHSSSLVTHAGQWIHFGQTLASENSSWTGARQAADAGNWKRARNRSKLVSTINARPTAVMRQPYQIAGIKWKSEHLRVAAAAAAAGCAGCDDCRDGRGLGEQVKKEGKMKREMETNHNYAIAATAMRIQ